MFTAMTRGHRGGVIAILQQSISRHLRAFGAMGILDRVAGDLLLGMQVVELSDSVRTRAGLLSVGTRLRDEKQANVVVLGCAGMAEHRSWLEQQLGIPVIEPAQAGAAMAIGRVLLGN